MSDLISRNALLADIEATIENSGCVNHEGEILECIAYADEIDAARQCAIETGICPMCEDCPDGCPVETPKDSRNIVTNADRIRGMSDEELANLLWGQNGSNRYWKSVQKYLDWLQQPAETEGTERHNPNPNRSL